MNQAENTNPIEDTTRRSRRLVRRLVAAAMLGLIGLGLAAAPAQAAVGARVVHEESLLLDLLAGLAELESREPLTKRLARRDEIWKRLEIQQPFRYPQVPSV